MKKIMLVWILFILLLPISVKAEQSEILELYEASGAAEALDYDSAAFPKFNADAMVSDIANGAEPNVRGVLQSILDFFFKSFKDNLKICFLVVAVAFVLGFFTNLQSEFGGQGAAESGYVVAYCVFTGVLTTAFSATVKPADEMIENISVMIKGTIPVLLSVLRLSGGVFTSGFLSQIMIALANVFNSIIQSVIIPLIFCAFAMSVAANMSNRISLSRAVPFLHKIIKWILLFVMAIYAGFFGVYGISGSAIDASAGKAVRFAVGSGIPLVGGVAADSIETVLATLGATQNIIGTVGMCVIVVAATAPIIKTAVMMWIFRLCTVIVEPFSDRRTVQLLSDTAECITLLFACMISVCLIFIGAIGIILMAGNFVR